MASWIAVLSIVLLTYIAGLGIPYACKDINFDRRENLHSLPAIFGMKKALKISSLLHIVKVISLMSLYWIFSPEPGFYHFCHYYRCALRYRTLKAFSAGGNAMCASITWLPESLTV